MPAAVDVMNTIFGIEEHLQAGLPGHGCAAGACVPPCHAAVHGRQQCRLPASPLQLLRLPCVMPLLAAFALSAHTPTLMTTLLSDQIQPTAAASCCQRGRLVLCYVFSKRLKTISCCYVQFAFHGDEKYTGQ